MILLDNSWLRQLVADGLGAIFTQLAFLAMTLPTAGSSSPVWRTITAGGRWRRW
jgi:hypothetical protein